MKKILSLLLACMMLFLTACNQTPSDGTGTGSQPSGSQNQEIFNEITLKDTIIKHGGQEMIDTPSRILFYANSAGSGSEAYTFYYSKADGKAYAYCFDPLCDHGGGKCLANPSNWTENIVEYQISQLFFINNRFYGVARHGQIYSFAFDGSDMKIEYGQSSYSLEEVNSMQFNWDPNFRSCGQYIYIRQRADENGNPHTLRYNTETKKMEDLTEQTGNYISPMFFYNGEIYGYDINHLWAKTDMELKEITSIETLKVTAFYGSKFFYTVFDSTDYKTSKAIGLEVHDMKTGEKTLLSNEMLGIENPPNYTIAAVDENYIYFYPYKKSKIGIHVDGKGREFDVYKYNEGKLYRVKHDGTECVCIYDNPNFAFGSSSDDAAIVGDKLLIWGNEYSFDENGYVKKDVQRLKVGTIGPDGTIDKFEDVELIY
ncbi:MAG: hypothetical protein IKW18_04720 [Clostridia bacterium]|nr:hypothetical protein [Clostridia bacterium]